MTLRTHRLTFPLTADQARELRAGDQVIIDGEITATAGIPTHERLLRCVDGAEPLPMPLAGHCLFHLGSFSRDTPEGFDVLYMNPTTSTRFNPHMPRLIRALSLHAVGGKGGLDQHSVDAMRETGCVYLSFLGGGAALHSDAIREVLQVGWPDMLTHYRLVRLRVDGLGPLTVAIDAHGNSRYNDAQAIAQSRYTEILAALDAARTQ